MNVVPLRRAASQIPGDLGVLASAWLQHRRARGAGANTVKAYADDVARLRAYAQRHDITLVQLVSERLLNRWIDDGVLHHGWSLRTASRRLSAVRSFLQWCRAEGYLDHDPAQHVQVRFRPRRVVAPEMDPLKAVITTIGQVQPVDLRDRAVLMLLLDAALRAGEVAGLDLPHDAAQPAHAHTVRLDGHQVIVRGKGGDSEVIGIEPQTVASLRAWLAVRPRLAAPTEPALFVNARGRRLSRQSLYTMVRARGAAVGLPKLHPHLFRHRRIGEVVEKLGLDMGCALARHRQKATTANVYGAHAAEVQRHAIRTMAPLGEIRA